VLCDGQYTRGNADIMSGFAQEIKTSPGRPADIIILKLSSRKPEEVDQNRTPKEITSSVGWFCIRRSLIKDDERLFMPLYFSLELAV
jgi:hypothetical protein